LLTAFEAGTRAPVGIDSLVATSRVTFAVIESVRTGRVVPILPSLLDDVARR
jgi:hypothetical protein